MLNRIRKENKERVKLLQGRIEEGNKLNMSSSGYEQDLTTEKRKEFLLSPPKRNFPVQGRQVKFIQTINPAPALTKEQIILQELFNGESFMPGTGECIPKTGNGNLGSESFFGTGETGEHFGFRKGEGGYKIWKH